MVTQSKPVPIFILMGTAGCGKTSIAEEMQKILGCSYVEGDSFHPKSNVDKMASGHPLDDDDRWPWLHNIRDHIVEQANSVKGLDMKSPSRAVIVTCSALKKVYRDILRDIPVILGLVTFVYLKGTHELLLKRIQSRTGHFMPPSMLQSQLDTLEEPDEKTENVIIATIVPPPDVEARDIVEVATKRGLLPVV
ncbi:shikimate kinase [Backusella circina FSU 941]|nr:shikimate kinase [Backusella circina FSU 941]